MPPRCFVESKSEDRRRIGGREEDLDLPTMLSALCLVLLILIFDCLSFFPSFFFLFVLCAFVFALGFVSFVSFFEVVVGQGHCSFKASR